MTMQGDTCPQACEPSQVDHAEDPTTAHRMPMAMATETLSDMIDTAALIQTRLIEGADEDELSQLRETGLAQAATYFDLMTQAARCALALKP